MWSRYQQRASRGNMRENRRTPAELSHEEIETVYLAALSKPSRSMKETQVTSLFRSKRIVIATIGSLGDLHPCLSLALELIRRGHHVTIATTPYYRSKVETLGITFQPMRPNWDPTDPELIRQCDDLKKGPEVLYRKMLLPELRGTYADLLSVASHADLLIAGELVYAAPLVAEKLKLHWISIILSPFSFFSSFDPSMMVNAPALIHLRKAGPSVYRAGLNVAFPARDAGNDDR